MDSSDSSDTPTALTSDTPRALNQARKTGGEGGGIDTPSDH
jgi:hypothetical protein